MDTTAALDPHVLALMLLLVLPVLPLMSTLKALPRLSIAVVAVVVAAVVAVAVVVAVVAQLFVQAAIPPLVLALPWIALFSARKKLRKLRVSPIPPVCLGPLLLIFTPLTLAHSPLPD